MHIQQIALLTGALLALASPTFAQGTTAGWYAGVGLGRLHTRFQPDYTFERGGDPQQFTNEADGLQVDILAGRRLGLSDLFSLGVQGSFSVNRFEWSLSIPSEPADLRYSLPYTAIASVLPEVHLGPVVSLFGELGGGAGRVREIKTSLNTSAYDIDQMRATFAFGGGGRVKIAPRAQLFAQYRQVRYSGFEYDTFNPAGLLIEHVKDTPRANGISFGVTAQF